MTKRTHLFIDADLVAFRAAAESSTRKPTKQSVDQGHESYFTWLKHTVPFDSITLCFTGSDNYRRKLNRHYKSSRGPKPELLSYSIESLKRMYPSLQEAKLEADDLLGIHCTDPQEDEQRILVSYDKDLLTLPTTIYDTLHQTWTRQTKDGGDRLFWTQCITGDRTDGYYGLPGVGEKGAKSLVDEIMLQPEAKRLDTLVAIYEDYYLPRDYALRQCQMAYILRYGDVTPDGMVKVFGTDQLL